MSRIVVPESTAKEIAKEAADENAATQEKGRQARHEKMLTDISDELKLAVVAYPTIHGRTRCVCGILVNKKSKFITDSMLQWPEVARIISDAILGPGQEYEVKT